MSQPWKLLPLAAVLAVIGALLLAPGGVTQPQTASADFTDCASDQGTLVIQIIDDNTGDLITVEGARVEVSPDPEDATGARDYTDGGAQDADGETGQITIANACADDGADPTAEYEAFLENLPATLEDCTRVDDLDSDFAPEDGGLQTLHLVVDCSDVATATPTATSGPADEINVSAAPDTIACSGTSIVTIEVLDAEGEPAPIGTEVEIETTIGEISPSSGQTTDQSAKAFVFLTAPASQGGTATITATSGDAEGSTTVTINCGATPTPTGTTAPPPTVRPGGGAVISPPNTGSAGLAGSDGGSSWLAIAGLGVVAATALGAVRIAKVRA